MAADDLTLRMKAAGGRAAAREIGQPTASVRKLRQELRGTGKGATRAHGRMRLFTSGLRPMVSLATSAGVALGALGLAGAMRTSITAASDLSEEINKTNVVFRGSERGLLEWSKTASDSFGQSRTQALESANVFGNMFVPLDFSRRRAAEMSKTMVELASDMASFNNADPSEVLEAMRSGLAGQAEPLRRYGVFINDARLRQEAMNKGIYDGEGVLTNHQRALATYSLLLKDSKDAQGDFARTSDGLANQQRTLRAQLADLSAELGSALLPLVTTGVTAVAGFVREFRNWEGTGGDVRSVLDGIAGVLVPLGTLLWDNRDAVVALTGAVVAGYAAWKAYFIVKRALALTRAGIALWHGLRTATFLATYAQLGYNSVLLANPIGLVIAALAALAVGFVIAYKKVDWFRDIVDSTWTWIKDHWPLLLGILTGPIGLAVIQIVKHWDSIRDGFIGAFRGLANIATGIFDTVKRAIIDGINAVIGVINGFIARYNDLPGALRPFGSIGEIPTLGGGSGDPSGRRVRTLRGRANRQFYNSLAVPPLAAAGAAGGGSVYVDATLNIDGEPAARSVQRASRRRKAVR